MSDFELYKEELIKESEENAIIKMIRRLRKLSLEDSQILESLEEDYGSSFSSSQLEEMLKSVK